MRQPHGSRHSLSNKPSCNDDIITEWKQYFVIRRCFAAGRQRSQSNHRSIAKYTIPGLISHQQTSLRRKNERSIYTQTPIAVVRAVPPQTYANEENATHCKQKREIRKCFMSMVMMVLIALLICFLLSSSIWILWRNLTFRIKKCERINMRNLNVFFECYLVRVKKTFGKFSKLFITFE
ncbi:hypothetical protein GJ496_009179 [Pomphorhynchus laevis]|nr:hypothetical protein GJ496_009179 [Pomphorhynchus laevis]